MSLATRASLIAAAAGAVAGAFLAPSIAYADVATGPALATVAGGLIVLLAVVVVVVGFVVVFVLRAIRRRRGVAQVSMRPVPPASAEQPASGSQPASRPAESQGAPSDEGPQ